jgi:hypothetical protein
VTRCEACAWDQEKRNQAAEVLAQLSQENREAQALQKALAKGSPPTAPKLWVRSMIALLVDLCSSPCSGPFVQAAKLGHKDLGSSDEVLTTELLLCWKPQPGPLVAFVALEQQMVGPSNPQDGGGGLGGSGSLVQFREIARSAFHGPRPRGGESWA